jgi:hypothetical protein
VRIEDSASHNTVGGAVAGNVIADNRVAGVQIGATADDSTTVGNSILENATFNNVGLGIVLAGYGDTPKTQGGPNDFQNYPVLYPSGTRGIVDVTLDSTPYSTFLVQFFANPLADPSGNIQGRIWLGEMTVKTDAGGAAYDTFTYKPDPVAPFLTATATDQATGNTSEFSKSVDTSPTTDVPTPSVTEGAADPTGPGAAQARPQGAAATSTGLTYRPTEIDTPRWTAPVERRERRRRGANLHPHPPYALPLPGVGERCTVIAPRPGANQRGGSARR